MSIRLFSPSSSLLLCPKESYQSRRGENTATKRGFCYVLTVQPNKPSLLIFYDLSRILPIKVIVKLSMDPESALIRCPVIGSRFRGKMQFY